jgi:hypothetical protein
MIEARLHPQHQSHAAPTPTPPIPVLGTPEVPVLGAPETKECPYCSERILASVKKCRFCGEYIDVALRAAEEAKAIALAKRESQIVNVNTNVHTVVGGATPRRRMSRITALGMLLCLFGFLVAFGSPTGGAVFLSLGIFFVIIGAFVAVFRAILSAFS